jgi:hypothetical protein
LISELGRARIADPDTESVISKKLSMVDLQQAIAGDYRFIPASSHMRANLKG